MEKELGPRTGKIYFPDTNVFVLQPLAVPILAGDWDSVSDSPYGGRELIAHQETKGPLDRTPNDVVVLSIAEQELDHIVHTKEQEDFARTASQARSVLYDIRRLGQRALNDNLSVVELPNGANVYFMRHDEVAYAAEYQKRLQDVIQVPMVLDLEGMARLEKEKADDLLIWNFEQWVQANKGNKRTKLTFVSQDKYCRSKIRDAVARVYLGAPDQVERTHDSEEEFLFENVSGEQSYLGLVKMRAKTEEEFRKFRDEGAILEPAEERPWQLRKEDLKPNQFLEMQFRDEKARLVISSDGATAKGLLHYDRFIEYIRKPVVKSEPKDESRSEKITIHTIEELIETHNIRLNRREDKKWRKRARDSPNQVYNELASKVPGLARRKQPVQQQQFGRLGVNFNQDLVPVAEQIMALEALCNPDVRIVTIVGDPGSGKTLWPFYAALALIDQGEYQGITYYRSPRGTHEGHGYLPGGERAKVAPWIQPALDAVMETLGGNNGDPDKEKHALAVIARLEAQKILQFPTDHTIQGNTWRGKRFVLWDEVQNESRGKVKLAAGRMGDETKLILVGDPNQLGAIEQKSHYFLTKRNTGLTHIQHTYAGQRLFAHITLSEECVRRSEAAKLSRLL